MKNFLRAVHEFLTGGPSPYSYEVQHLTQPSSPAPNPALTTTNQGTFRWDDERYCR